MSTVFQDDRVDTTYELSDLPRLYILKNFPPSPKEDAEFKKKKKEVVSLFDRLQVERGTHRYDPRSIACRTPSDSVSAKLLIDALDRTRRGQFKEALELVSSAASLDPSFAEVYRVEAYVQFWAGNHIAAEDSYETAVSYDPKSAPLRYWFGGFLLRGYHDPGRAKTQFLVARELDPCNPRIAIEIARCQMHLGEFREASDEIAEVLQSAELPLKERRISYDTYLQNAIRWAQRYMAHGDYGRSLELMQGLVTSIEEAPSDWWDSRIAATAAQSIPLISQVAPLCGRAEDAGTLIRRIELVCNNNFSGPNLPSREPKRPIEDAAGHAESTADADTHRGKISRVLWERRFGFIQMTDGTDLFFHFTQVKNRDYLALDAEVEFSISKGVDGRPVAVGVQCKHAIPHPVNIGQKMTGTIKSIAGTYGFVFGEDGHDYFFHKGNVSGEIQFGSLKKGDLVMFIIEAAARGPVAGQLALID